MMLFHLNFSFLSHGWFLLVIKLELYFCIQSIICRSICKHAWLFFGRLYCWSFEIWSFASDSNSITLRNESWSVLFLLEIHKCICKRWFSTESSRWDKFYKKINLNFKINLLTLIKIWFEIISYLFDFIIECWLIWFIVILNFLCRNHVR